MFRKLRSFGPATLALAFILVALPAAGQDLDFRRYVSIGDSLTAGFISGGLIADVQENSYPSLIFQRATGQPAALFEQPLIAPPGLPPILQLRSLRPLIISTLGGVGQPLNLSLPRPYSNLAVPGADTRDALDRLSDGGIHDVVLRGIGTQVESAILQQPTFITVWLGNNDALGAATSGVPIDGVTLTSAASFDADIRTIIDRLAATGADIAIATVPDVTSIPFVTTVPAVLVDPVTSQPVLVNGQPVPLIGPDGPLVPGRDFVLLTGTQELLAGNGIPAALGGSGRPLSNQVVLSGAEVALIRSRVAQFNDSIRSAAGAVDAAVVDVASLIDDIGGNGLVVGGIDFGVEFLTGGLFSYDGVHGTPFGYAIIANAFIDGINNHFGSNVRRVGLGPFVFGPLSSRGTGLAGAAIGGMKFSRAAEDQLRSVLGMPHRGEMRQLMRQHGVIDVAPPRDGNDGGGSGRGPAATCNLARGHGKYCDVCGPCTAGEGDCDLKPNQCEAGLVCAQDVGERYGLHWKIDVCQAP